jgi:hypothetical protein
MEVARETLERWANIARAHGHEGMRDEIYALLAKPDPAPTVTATCAGCQDVDCVARDKQGRCGSYMTFSAEPTVTDSAEVNRLIDCAIRQHEVKCHD